MRPPGCAAGADDERPAQTHSKPLYSASLVAGDSKRKAAWRRKVSWQGWWARVKMMQHPLVAAVLGRPHPKTTFGVRFGCRYSLRHWLSLLRTASFLALAESVHFSFSRPTRVLAIQVLIAGHRRATHVLCRTLCTMAPQPSSWRPGSQRSGSQRPGSHCSRQ